ncbi:sigma-70 family RNA polymerase sigma factor [Luteimonas sp. MJ250]|uniref:RNA polymerase sigma factor n=1 Tax=Luteimonas sp. MJ250 TaxID=3129236 RepID=UPI0031BAE5DD
MDAISSHRQHDGAEEFSALLQQHRGIVFKVAGTYARDADDREDLAQDIAAQLWRAWPRYDPSRSFSTWMYRVALNVGISHLRGDGSRRHLVPLEEGLRESVAPDTVDHERDQQSRLLHGFIATLEPLNRALLLLYLEDRSTRDMAEVLGMSESNVTTRISRLKRRIRDHVAPTGTP